MTRRALVLLALILSGCGGTADDAPPVAAVTVSLDPKEVAPGAPVETQFKIELEPGGSMPPGEHVLFVHVVDANGNTLWTDDHMPPVPSVEWKAGSAVEYGRVMFVPRTTPAGPLQVVVGIYAPGTGDRVPLKGEATERRAYPMATLDVKPDAGGTFVAFTEGWHNPESNDVLTREWRWSKGTGKLVFRNPKKAAQLWLELDQPVATAEAPAEVEVRLGETVLDTIALQGNAPAVRRVAIPTEALGDGGTVEVAVVPKTTFIPANVPALKNDDRRELGVRVFNAYLDVS